MLTGISGYMTPYGEVRRCGGYFSIGKTKRSPRQLSAAEQQGFLAVCVMTLGLEVGRQFA